MRQVAGKIVTLNSIFVIVQFVAVMTGINKSFLFTRTQTMLSNFSSVGKWTDEIHSIVAVRWLL